MLEQARLPVPQVRRLVQAQAQPRLALVPLQALPLQRLRLRARPLVLVPVQQALQLAYQPRPPALLSLVLALPPLPPA
jgi:hypothetical protein